MQVLNRSSSLRKRIEERLNTRISEKSELESKPNMEQEVWKQPLDTSSIQKTPRKKEKQL
jgi:hypothetical protein